MEKVSSYDEFKPDGVTNYGKKADMLYKSYYNGPIYKFDPDGPAGNYFVLLKEPHHTAEDIKRAKKYIKDTQEEVVKVELVELKKGKEMMEYLDVWITRHDGTVFDKPLRLAEAHKIRQLAKDNKELRISLRTMSLENYKSFFRDDTN